MSTPQYRLLFLLPHPLNGGRWPIAALVATAHGVRAVAAEHQHHACGCWGSMASEAALKALATLGASTVLHLQRPPELGPHFLFSEAHTLPSGISHPVEWVRLHILPRPPEGGSPHANRSLS